jgi:hypothetical protein
MTITTPDKPKKSPISWIALAFILLMALGAGLRLYDLTDEPIDFHPTRQLRGAIIARGMYYEMLPSANPQTRQDAIAFWSSTGQYEPSILERAAALTYLLAGQEIPWLARLYNGLFWLIGGLALFDLARRVCLETGQDIHPGGPTAGSWIGAGLALAYYLVLPFGVQASRAFQPDPGMVVWIVLASYTAYRWSESHSWKWAILAGIAAGLAVLTKAVAFYTIAGMLAALTIASFWKSKDHSSSKLNGGLLGALSRMLRNPQVWAVAALTVIPTLLYYLGRGGRASEYLSSWTLALSHLLLEPATYLRWLNLVQELVTPLALIFALAGIWLAKGRGRAMLAGLWLGYFAYGLFLPYQMTSHSYYHLQLVPIVALSLAPLAMRFSDWLAVRGKVWQVVAAGLALVALVYSAWQAAVPLYSRDYRNEPTYWSEIASFLPEDGKIIALTQDYGYRLMYYGWRKVVLWPNRGEIKLSVLRGSEKEFLDYFTKRIEGKSYFLITAFGQFEDQPELQKMLQEHFPVLAQGNGYLIFDLQHPKSSG